MTKFEKKSFVDLEISYPPQGSGHFIFYKIDADSSDIYVKSDDGEEFNLSKLSKILSQLVDNFNKMIDKPLKI